MKYIVSSQERPDNIPMYSIHSDLNSFILHTDEDIDKQIGEIETNLGTPHHPPHIIYDELDTQNYHDPEQLCLEDWEFDFL